MVGLFLPVQSLVELVAVQEFGVFPGVQVKVIVVGYVPLPGLAINETVGGWGTAVTVTLHEVFCDPEFTLIVLAPVEAYCVIKLAPLPLVGVPPVVVQLKLPVPPLAVTVTFWFTCTL